MLPALANGLRAGGAFDVLAVPFADAAAAQEAAERAEAAAIFYGTPDRPLATALQQLGSPIRARGGRVLAVLQREQAGQRDACFRAGASDLIFMPMPKDQFVARVSGAVRLLYPGDPGIAAGVSVATRSATSNLNGATVTPSGVHAARALPFKPGETVRLSWDRFQVWGLVVQGVPAAQIRFAGLVPAEEAQIRDWLVGISPAAPATLEPPVDAPPSPATAAGVASAAIVPATSASAPVPAAIAPEIAAIVPETAASIPATAARRTDAAVSGEKAAAPAEGGRSAPVAGPPPGFADRKPVRPQTARTPRWTPAVVQSLGAAAPPGVVPVAAPGAGSAAPALPNGVLSSLPDTDLAAALFARSEPPAAAPAPVGPSWPVPADPTSCLQVALELLKGNSIPAEASPEIAVAARKIVGLLGSTERAALDKAGAASHLAAALAARVALEVATAAGVRLYSASPAAVVDASSVVALSQLADAAGARLQGEANEILSKGDVDQLQLVTAASAALSREALNFRATADRLRGIEAAPRLGGGALDPHLVIAGQAPRPLPAKSAEPAPVRAELRDFTALDDPGRGVRAEKVALIVLLVAFIAAFSNAFFFNNARVRELPVEQAGRGVTRLEVAGQSALVTVSPEWVAAGGADLAKLLEVLRSREVQKAMLIMPDGRSAGILDVNAGKIAGLPRANPKDAQTVAPH